MGWGPHFPGRRASPPDRCQGTLPSLRPTGAWSPLRFPSPGLDLLSLRQCRLSSPSEACPLAETSHPHVQARIRRTCSAQAPAGAGPKSSFRTQDIGTLRLPLHPQAPPKTSMDTLPSQEGPPPAQGP